MVNTILAQKVNHIVAKGDNPAWPKGSKSRGFSNSLCFASHKSFVWLKNECKDIVQCSENNTFELNFKLLS